MPSAIKRPTISTDEEAWLRDVAKDDSAVAGLQNKLRAGQVPWVLLIYIPVAVTSISLAAMIWVIVTPGAQSLASSSPETAPKIVYYVGSASAIVALIVFLFADFNQNIRMARLIRALLDAASAADHASHSSMPHTRKKLTATLSTAAEWTRKVYRVRPASSKSAYQRRVHKRMANDLSGVLLSMMDETVVTDGPGLELIRNDLLRFILRLRVNDVSGMLQLRRQSSDGGRNVSGITSLIVSIKDPANSWPLVGIFATIVFAVIYSR